MRKQWSLKPHDVVVAMELTVQPGTSSYTELAHLLGLSAGETHKAVQRCVEAGLLVRVKQGRGPLGEVYTPVLPAVQELLLHGVRYVFPAIRGATTRGVPTAHAAPPLREHLMASDALPPVWPDPTGRVRGEALVPLYPGAPGAAAREPRLYACLTLIDALRIGRARERALAGKLLAEELRRDDAT